METIISSLQEDNHSLHKPALNKLLDLAKKTDISTLKLLNDHRIPLTDFYNANKLHSDDQRTLADILSLIYIITYSSVALTYRLLGNTVPLSEFGHQYIKKLLSSVCKERREINEALIEIVISGIKFLFSHNCECDGIDFLLELRLEYLIPFFVDDYNFARVENYLSESCFYLRRCESILVDIYRRRKDWVKLVVMLIRLKDTVKENRIIDQNNINSNPNINIHNSNSNSNSNISNPNSNNSNISNPNSNNPNSNINPNDPNSNASNIYNSMNREDDDIDVRGYLETFDITDKEKGEKEVNLENVLNRRLYVFSYEKEALENNINFILNICSWLEFLQILFILGRNEIILDLCKVKEILHERRQNEDVKDEHKLDVQVEEELVGRIINNNYLPFLIADFHKDTELLSPFTTEKIFKGAPKVDKEMTLRLLSFVSIANSFVHLGFTFDHLFFTGRETTGIDLYEISKSDKVDLISIVASLGLIKKNRYMTEDESNNNDMFLLYDDYLETYAYSDGHTYRKAGSLLALSLLQNTYDSEHSTLAFLIDNLESTCRYMKMSSLLGIEYLYCGSKLGLTRDVLINQLYSDSVETVGMACFTLGSIFYGTMDHELIGYFMTVYLERRVDSDNPFFFLILLGISLLYMGCEDRVSKQNMMFFRENGIDSIINGMAYLGSGRTDIIEIMVEDYANLTDEDESGEKEKKIATKEDNIEVTTAKESLTQDDTTKDNTTKDNSIKDMNIKDKGTKDNNQQESDKKYIKKQDDNEHDNNEQGDKYLNTKESGNNSNDERVSKNILKSVEMGKINQSTEEPQTDENPDSNNIYKSLILFSITLLSINDNHTRNIAKKMLINLSLKDKTNTVPLCLSLLYASEPDPEVIEYLSRSINTSSPINSILALGMIGAGTNNTRIIGMLESQYAYYQKNVKISSMLRIAQGLVMVGKGTLSLSPLLYDKTVIMKKGLIGILGLLFMFCNESSPVLSKHSYLFYLLNQSIMNKFVTTVDENLEIKNVTVRVGRPIETVGMAGKPKGISAIITHNSPTGIQCDEKAALYEEEGWTYKGYVEDVVVIKKSK